MPSSSAARAPRGSGASAASASGRSGWAAISPRSRRAHASSPRSCARARAVQSRVGAARGVLDRAGREQVRLAQVTERLVSGRDAGGSRSTASSRSGDASGARPDQRVRASPRVAAHGRRHERGCSRSRHSARPRSSSGIAPASVAPARWMQRRRPSTAQAGRVIRVSLGDRGQPRSSARDRPRRTRRVRREPREPVRVRRRRNDRECRSARRAIASQRASTFWPSMVDGAAR